MATLRDRLTPQEQQRFKQLYNQNFFDRITLERFTQRIGDEFRYIDMLEKRKAQAEAAYKNITGSTAADVQRRSELQYTIDYATRELPKRRAGAFDAVLSDSLMNRERRVRQNVEYASMMREDGTPAPLHMSPFGAADSDKTLMQHAWDNYWQEKGVLRGAADIGVSALTGPIRGAQQLATGTLGENPYEAGAEIGAFLPVLRAGGRLASASSRVGQIGGGIVRRVVDDPLWKVPSYSAQVADMIGAEEGAWIEAVGEAGLEGVGASGDLIRHLRSGRGRRIFQGFDPQAAEDAETTESTTEHDQTTGSHTAPQLSPEAERVAARARADSAVESANAQAAVQAAQQQTEQELRRQAWERMLARTEGQETAAVEQAAREQRFIDADDAYNQQQAQATEKVEYTKEWLPFYSDLAGGSQAEGIRTLNAEYDAGVRDPIRHRYDQIATGLQPQLGAIPSELHRETEQRLRKLIGEKWYNAYRGIDEKPTPQQRAARAEAAAEQIVEGGTTDATSSTGSNISTTGTDRDQSGAGEVPTADGLPATESGAESAVSTQGVPATQTPEVDDTPEAQKGDIQTAYLTDGTPYRVRPVVRALDEVIPSHDIDGNKSENYPEALQPRGGRETLTSRDQGRENAGKLIWEWVQKFMHHFRDGPPLTSKQYPKRTIAGTGRTNMLKYVRDNLPEKWQEGQEKLRTELANVGIDPAILDGIPDPVLTYELVDDVDELLIAKDTNIGTTLDVSSAEQAEQDADNMIDADLLVRWTDTNAPFATALQAPENQEFRNMLISRVPTHLRPAFLTSDETGLSQEGVQRIQNALIRYVFGDESISQQLINEGTLEEASKLGLMLQYIIPTLAQVKSKGLDIGSEMSGAASTLISLSKQADRTEIEGVKLSGTKEDRLWGYLQNYLQTPDTTDPASTLERQILYLLYSKRNAEKQLATHFLKWAEFASEELNTAAGLGFFEPDPVQISEQAFDGIIRGHLSLEAFEVDDDRQKAGESNVWRTPGNLPPELQEIRAEIDDISGATAQTERFNAWVDAFLARIHAQEATDATPTADQTGTDVEGEATDPGAVGTGGTERGTGDRRDIPDRSDPGRDSGASERPDTEGEPGGTLDPDERDGTQGDATGAAPGGTQRPGDGQDGAAVASDQAQTDAEAALGINNEKHRTSHVSGISRFFTKGKTGEKDSTPGSNEDSAAVDEAAGRYVVSDGVSQSLNSSWMSRALVNQFVSTPIADLHNWMQPIRNVLTGLLRNIATGKRQHGNVKTWSPSVNLIADGGGPSATLSGLEFFADNRWRATGFGDSAMFRVRNGTVDITFGDTWAPGAPAQVTAALTHEGFTPDLQTQEGDVQQGDVFLLMTDAMAEWFKAEVDAGRGSQALTDLRKIETDADFKDFIETRENNKTLKPDDQTFVLIDGMSAVNSVAGRQAALTPEGTQETPDATQVPDSDSGSQGSPAGDQATDVDTAVGATTPPDTTGSQAGAEGVPSQAEIEEALNKVSVGVVSLDEWNASEDTGKKSFLQKSAQSLPNLQQAGTITAEEAAERREAIELLQRSIQETPNADTTETEVDSDVSQGETAVASTEIPSTEAQTPVVHIDTNQVVGVSRRRSEPTTTSTVSPAIQRALDTLGITAADWETAKAEGTAEDLLNPFTTSDDMATIDAVGDLSLDIAGDLDMDMDFDEDADPDWDDLDDDEDLFSDVQPGVLKDITDEQRSDFETVRRKLFLARTIARLEAKTDRSLVENAQLSALKATQRTDAQQEVYEGLLNRFIDRQVARLSAKNNLTSTEERILDALVAVQGDGLPEEASELSLYADLDTPEQAHSSPLAETRTLAGVQAPDTSQTPLNLPNSVVSDRNKLSPAQQTGVKAIVAAFKRKIHTTTDATVQGGFLLGDKPGVGKTRQALATIWHYMREGVQKHFIVAPNQQILENFSTDFAEMGGPAHNISNYNAQNPKPTTPIGTATYDTLVSKPSLKQFMTRKGNQNAIADVVEHLIGVRPTLAQTHPGQYGLHQQLREAFERIGIHRLPGTHQREVVENAVTELRRQAGRVNLENPANVEQFRNRMTPHLADMLLNERRGGGTQTDMFTGSELHDTVAALLAFAQTHISAQPDPNFAAAAEAFEGVIVLDEAHKTAGTNSQIGQTVATLQQLLPNAKFLYMTATPFKELSNFWVAERLGLWGANQAFPNFGRFFQTFRRAARATKEVIPLHLKQIGRYISRALSSKETRYTPVEIPLTDTEKAQYDTAVRLVKNIEDQFKAAIDKALASQWGAQLGKAKGSYKAKYMQAYYNSTQKFFLAVLDAMKAQGLSEQIQDQLKNGDKIIVQLENTWSKTTENAKRRGNEIPGPFDLLIDFVENENLFPVHAHIPEVRISRRTGEEYVIAVKRMEYNDAGQQVPAVDPALKQLQTNLIAALQQAMQQGDVIGSLPFAAEILHAAADAAGMSSGEISGRTASDAARSDLATQFSETTDLNMIILGPAGLTGINLPVTEKIRDQVGNLYHYLVQSSWNVNTFEQGLGRGKRANSAIDPHYIIAHQDLPGADRVLGATLAKFAEMGALAGQADSALMQNVDKVEGETNIEDDPEAEVFDEDTVGEKGFVFGAHGQEALEQLWLDLYNDQDFRIPDALGLPRPELDATTGVLVRATVPDIKSFFQRLLHQTTENQPGIYGEFEKRLKRILAHNKELGTLDTGANDQNYKDGVITDRLTIYTDPDTGQTAEMVKLDVQHKLPRRSYEFLGKVILRAPGYEHFGGDLYRGLYTDADGYIWAVFENPFSDSGETTYTRWGPRGAPIPGLHKGQNRVTQTQLDRDFTNLINLTPEHLEGGLDSLLSAAEPAMQLWEEQDASMDAYVDSELFMATGLILPKWNNFNIRGYPELMAVIPMQGGSNLHGRVIPAAAVSQVLQKIGGVNPNYFEDGDTTTPLPDDPNIDIPQLVRDIIGEQTDTRIKTRLENIVDHIHNKLPLMLRGHRVQSAAEAALLGQLIRDPQVEHTWIVYQRDGRILKIEPMSLSRKGETKAGDFAHIKAIAAEEGADAVMRIHNHPSGIAKWSGEDKKAALQWHRELGTLMKEDIIVDSGTYAYRTFENGKYTWHEDVQLDPDRVGWRTDAPPINVQITEQRPTDVLYQNPLIRAARDAATYMWGLKHSTNVAELVYVDTQTGKITKTYTDTSLRIVSDPAQYMQSALMSAKGQHVHVMMWGNANSVAEAIQNVEGVDSVWIGSQRFTGLAEIEGQPQETDTRTEDEKITNSILERMLGDESPPPKKIKAPVPAHKVSNKKLQKALDDREFSSDATYVTVNVDGIDIVVEPATDTYFGYGEKKTRIHKGKLRPVTRIIDGVEYYLTPYRPNTQTETIDFADVTDAGVLATARDTGKLFYEEFQMYVLDALKRFMSQHPDLIATGDRYKIGNTPLQAYREWFEGTLIKPEWLAADPILQELTFDNYKTKHAYAYYEDSTGSEYYLTPTGLSDKNAYDIYDLDWDVKVTRPDRHAAHVIRRRRGDVSRYEQTLESGSLKSSGLLATTDPNANVSDWDALTDNKDFVFLAPTPSPYMSSQSGHYGYFFDPEKLIENGASVSTADSIAFYTPIVEKAKKRYKVSQQELVNYSRTGEGSDTVKQAYAKIQQETARAAKKYRFTGEAALEKLRNGEVAEILVPTELSHDGLVGVIEDSKFYQLVSTDTLTPKSLLQRVVDRIKGALSDVTADEQQLLSDYTAAIQRTNPDSAVYRVHAPENLTMQGRGRAKTAALGEKILNTFIDSNAGIMKVLNAWTPTARRWARLTKNEFVSGFGRLAELEAPDGSDDPAPADVIKDILRERQLISKLNAGRALSALEPHLLAFNKLARKRTGLRTSATAPKTRNAKRQELSHQVWNFIEHNTPIENDAELLSLAEEMKDAWRELLIYDTQKIVELMSELEKINEKLYVTDDMGKREEWHGVPFDGFQWDAENKAYTKKGQSYSIEEAHRAANKLYMPHYHRGRSPLQEYSALQKVLDTLNTLLATDSPDAAALEPFGVTYATGVFTHTPTGKTATTPYEMVRIVADHLATEDAALQGILNYYEDEGRVGYYGHLERTRETDDRFYVRDISLMAENRVRLWDRLAEVAVIGQQHPLLGDSPRMKTLIEQVLNFNKTPREAALRKFVEALNSGAEGMFERMPQFASGVDVALDIMQHWMERDADGKKTGRYQEIDIGRMGLDAETLTELERIGLITKDANGNYQIGGENINQRHANIARHIHEFYNTLALRKKAVHSLVLGLGNWHTRDPLEMESSEFWKKINDTVTVLTLNHGVAIQNMLEIPLVSMMTGANPLFKGLKNMTNAEYRSAMQQLARGLSHARKFMADTSLADKYLGSPLTFFSKSDEFSRAAGLGIGLENAKEKIAAYAEADTDKKRETLAREMSAVRLNSEIVASIPAAELESVLAAAEQLILDNKIETVFDSTKGEALSNAEKLAGTMLRSMFYVSDETFKQYDATTLPQFMLSRNPMIRVFMKYKSWMLQQNRLVYNQLRRAYREAKKGNLEPLGNFVAASAMMGLGIGGLLWLYSGLQGDDDDKTVYERLFKGLAAAQTFGIASVMFELAMYAEGNWYQMQNLLVKQAAGPTFSVAAQMVSPVFTGDFARSGTEALRRLPIVSFSRRVGGWRLLEEATGLGEEEE